MSPKTTSSRSSPARAARSESVSTRDHIRVGIDVGGTTIKGAAVDTQTGKLLTQVQSADTPDRPSPDRVGEVAAELTSVLSPSGAIGCALPGVVGADRLLRAPNLAAEWADPGALTALKAHLGADAVVVNDADAVGLAELRFSQVSDARGLTIVLTFGTGIGSALIFNGELIANAELGELSGPTGPFEHVASGRAITTNDLSPQQWATAAQPYFDELEKLLSPTQWIVSGGLSKSFDEYFARVRLDQPIRVAHLGEHTGIVGAALAANGLGPNQTTRA